MSEKELSSGAFRQKTSGSTDESNSTQTLHRQTVEVLKGMIAKRKSFYKFKNSLGQMSKIENQALKEALKAIEKAERQEQLLKALENMWNTKKVK